MKNGVIFIAEEAKSPYHATMRKKLLNYANQYDIDILKTYTVPITNDGEFEYDFLEKTMNNIAYYNEKVRTEDRIFYFITNRLDDLEEFRNIDYILDYFEDIGVITKTLGGQLHE